MAEHEFDLLQALKAIDCRDGDWFAAQPETMRRRFIPLIVLRWAANIRDGKHAADLLLKMNARVNLRLWDIERDHPELVFRLMASCGPGSPQRHAWLAMPGRPASSNAARDLLAGFHPLASEAEIDLLMSLHNRDSFAAFVEDTATVDAKTIMKVYDEHYGDAKQAKTARPGGKKTRRR